MFRAKPKSLRRVALLVAPLAFALSACETLENLNPFDDQAKKTPLSGDRRSVFPQGVPGVQYSAPPQQPSNSNITLDNMQQQNPQPAPEAAEQPEQQTQPPQRQTRNQKNRANDGDDPWTGARR